MPQCLVLAAWGWRDADSERRSTGSHPRGGPVSNDFECALEPADHLQPFHSTLHESRLRRTTTDPTPAPARTAAPIRVQAKANLKAESLQVMVRRGPT